MVGCRFRKERIEITGNLQIKNGTYYMVINAYERGGKRKQKWINTHLPERGNKKRAAAMLDATLAEYESSQIVPSTLKVADYLEQWLPTMKTKVRPNTFRSYEGNMQNHIIPYFKEHPIALQKLRASDLEDYYAYKMQPGSSLKNNLALSALTLKHHHQNISKALSDAVHDGLIVANPASSAKTPRAKKKHVKFYTPEQLEQLLVLFRGTPVELPVTLCMVYGFRRSEVLGLRWENVDFTRKTIHICETLQQGIGGNYVDETKTEASNRIMPFTPEVEELLLKQKKLQSDRKELLGNYYQDTGYVCTWPNGVVISPNYLTRTWKKTIENCNLPILRFHDLRHSVASNLFHAGRSVIEVRDWLGHSCASTTLNTYSHGCENYTREVANTVSLMLKITP